MKRPVILIKSLEDAEAISRFLIRKNIIFGAGGNDAANADQICATILEYILKNKNFRDGADLYITPSAQGGVCNILGHPQGFLHDSLRAVNSINHLEEYLTQMNGDWDNN